MLIFLIGVINIATRKSTATTTKEPKKPIAEVRAENEKLQKEIEKLTTDLEKIRNGYYCHMCGRFLKADAFYQSTDPRLASGHAPYCKKCITALACRRGHDGVLQGPTKASVMLALEYVDKPFISTLWDASYYESMNVNTTKATANIWSNYIKNVSMRNYNGMRWKDGDIFKGNTQLGKLDAALPSELEEEEFEKERQARLAAMEECEINRRDVIAAIGYDPFANYPNSADKPMLYASLISFIDEDAKDDGMKMRAIIQIVKTYNQIEKINDTLDRYVNDASELPTNIPSLDKLSGVVARLNNAATTLAKENGISVNYNSNKSKGANTLSGKIKHLSEIGFRDAQINTFDYETCEGMRQVAELSEKARHLQIGYDDNIAQEIKDIKVELVEKLTKERDAALESLRLLLVENMDLKESLKTSQEI